VSTTLTGAAYPVAVGFTAGARTLWPVSKKLAVMRALCEHLEGITRDAGYEYDLTPTTVQGKTTPRVWRGRAVFGDETPVPCLSVLEAPTPDESPFVGGENEGQVHAQWVLLVQGWVQTPDDHPTDPAYQFMAAVEHRLHEIISVRSNGRPVNADAYMLGNRIAGLRVGPGVVRPPQDQVSSRAFFYLPLAVKLAVDISQPFVAA
jgi:hypothetical protein